MATVRVASAKRSRLVRVTLEKVPLQSRFGRLDTARRLREKRWKDELRPDVGYSPELSVRLDALEDAVETVRAAIYPKRTHLVGEEAVADAVAKGRYEP